MNYQLTGKIIHKARPRTGSSSANLPQYLLIWQINELSKLIPFFQNHFLLYSKLDHSCKE
jgi:hypothetical protein